MAKTKALISFAVTAKLICVFVFAYANIRFSHVAAHIGIKHVFPCINIRRVPREVLKTEGEALGFQHRPRNPANVNARKNMFNRYYCIKVSKKLIIERYFNVLFWHYFVLIFFTSAHKDNFHLYPHSRAICKQLLNHGGKTARIHHALAEFTNCRGCLPSILIVDNCIFFTFRRQVRLCSSLFRLVSILIFISATDTGNTNGREMDN